MRRVFSPLGTSFRIRRRVWPQAPLLACLLLLTPLPAIANDTALHHGRFGPEPVGGGFKGRESAIRMKAEKLTIAMGKVATTVTCRFTFENTLKVQAIQLVGFPDEGAGLAEEVRRRREAMERDFMPPLRKVRTTVDGVEVAAPIKFGYVKTPASGEGWVAAGPQDGWLMAWHAARVAFPPGKPVIVERHYETDNAENAIGARFFEYVTHTGGAWHGKIGELVAEVTLVDGLTVADLRWPGDAIPVGQGGGVYVAGMGSRPAKAGWQVLDPTHLQLHWRDFEPRVEKARSGFALWIQIP